LDAWRLLAAALPLPASTLEMRKPVADRLSLLAGRSSAAAKRSGVEAHARRTFTYSFCQRKV
jgi:hypothetical protein